jgi:hypothetical protein
VTIRTLVLFLIFACSCCHTNPKKDTYLPDGGLNTPCGRMCRHFRKLKCEEGDPFYDSDMSGPVGVPNTTCEMFCESQMGLGVDLNIKCATKAPTCDEIEVYREMRSCV